MYGIAIACLTHSNGTLGASEYSELYRAEAANETGEDEGGGGDSKFTDGFVGNCLTVFRHGYVYKEVTGTCECCEEQYGTQSPWIK